MPEPLPAALGKTGEGKAPASGNLSHNLTPARFENHSPNVSTNKEGTRLNSNGTIDSPDTPNPPANLPNRPGIKKLN